MPRLLLLLIIFSFLPAPLLWAHEEVQAARALEIQAAFLIKFSSYVKWPDTAFSGPNAPIVIGIFGPDPFGSIVDKIARSYGAGPRGLEIRRFKNPASIHQCHILFIPPSETTKMEKIITALKGRPVLLVGNSADFLDKSGIINFVKINNKIRFDISQSNGRKAGLKISSKLLTVAHKVK